MKKFDKYYLIIIICIILIILAACIIFKPKKQLTPSGIEVIQTGVKENEEITEETAKKVAIKQFKKLGEKDVKEEQLQVAKIQRKTEEYYYISSKQNTLEIKIKGGNITKINSASVEE